jgi:RNA polymerase-binding transcription factor
MLTKNELEKYRQQLLKLRRGLDDRVDAIRDEVLAKERPDFEGPGSEGQPDVGALASHAFEHEVNVSLFGSEERLREEIQGALQRIEKGMFGRCEDCGKPIPRARLNLVPYARQCMACVNEPSRGRPLTP